MALDSAPGLGHRPKHHRMPRVQGSSTGGVSQIVFGDVGGVTGGGSFSSRQKGCDETAAAHAARNRTSKVFADEPAQAPPRSRYIPSGGHSSLDLKFDEPRNRRQRLPPPQSAAEPVGRNPILNNDSSSRTPPRGSACSPRYDPNRSSVAGGIFGDECVQPVRKACYRDANENSMVPKAGTKRLINGHIEYCA
eukprot:CAMPEP_0194525096 /NCGR_PEP_ID=MMETSP0253-20130528/60438_1 /TAXON_ID=2966 /ORGANISM="Noctiluca scintillans" /LENGTH=192 /DNA_ID=CAMNT_0039369789 /DNA_START=1 /DNA_END=579 /DNA_ORIENTATION=+